MFCLFLQILLVILQLAARPMMNLKAYDESEGHCGCVQTLVTLPIDNFCCFAREKKTADEMKIFPFSRNRFLHVIIS